MKSGSPYESGHSAENRLPELDGLRGIAALTVFFSHAIGVLPSSPLLDALKSSPLRTFWDGTAAVGLFFVLSGFVLALPFQGNHKSLSYIEFVTRRCFRIYPAYWLALVLAMAIKTFLFDSQGFNGLSDWVTGLWLNPIRIEDVVRHMLLIVPLDTHRIDPVIWTMVLEMKISLIFPAVILALRFFPSLLGATVIMTACSLVAGFGVANRVMFLEVLPEFVAGALLARHHREIAFKFELLPAYLSLGLLTFALALYGNWLTSHWGAQFPRLSFHLSATGAALIIILATSRASLKKLFRTKFCQHIGRVSYSFYLIHLPILLAILSLIYPILKSPAISIGISLVASYALAEIMNRWIETPTQRLGRTFWPRLHNLYPRTKIVTKTSSHPRSNFPH